MGYPLPLYLQHILKNYPGGVLYRKITRDGTFIINLYINLCPGGHLKQIRNDLLQKSLA